MDITQDGEFPQGVEGTVHGQLEAACSLQSADSVGLEN